MRANKRHSVMPQMLSVHVVSRYIDSRAENGLTALHLAASSGNLECVRLLLDGGASMMVRTVDLDVISEVTAPAGSTPLHVAAMSGNVCILQAMLQVRLLAHVGYGSQNTVGFVFGLHSCLSVTIQSRVILHAWCCLQGSALPCPALSVLPWPVLPCPTRAPLPCPAPL